MSMNQHLSHMYSKIKCDASSITYLVNFIIVDTLMLL
jgi:hypothetical protein